MAFALWLLTGLPVKIGPSTDFRFLRTPNTATIPHLSDVDPMLRALLFAFDRSSLSDITGSGRAQLDQLVNGLEEHAAIVQSIRVLG